MKPLPKSLQKLVAEHSDKIDEGWTEQDSFERDGGWSHWVYLKPGWHNAVVDGPGLHIIHEASAREVIRQFRGIKPCDCDDCRKEKANG